MTPVELLATAGQLRATYVQPWFESYIKIAGGTKSDEAKAYFAGKFIEIYEDAACDDKVLDALTNAVIWSGGFKQFQRKGDRRQRARTVRQLREEVAASHSKSMATLQVLVPIIQQIFVDNVDPLIAKLTL
jgi:hypothetical protein